MKKTILAAAMVAALGLNASALYFDGGLTGTTGPHGYSGYKLNLVLGQGNLAFEPSVTSYKSDWLNKKTFRTYGLRGAWESDFLTIGGEAGMTPEVDNYTNKYVGGDITISLTPTSGGKSRLAGPGARSMARSGEGITRVDVGAAIKQTMHTTDATGTDLDTEQTQAMVFAGAKVFILNLSASYSKYSYGDDDATTELNFVPGHNFVIGDRPDSSFSARVDLPSTLPMITPFAGYTLTRYKNMAGVSTSDSKAYLLGAYIDLSMVVANVAYQVMDDEGSNDNFVSIGAGIKF